MTQAKPGLPYVYIYYMLYIYKVIQVLPESLEPYLLFGNWLIRSLVSKFTKSLRKHMKTYPELTGKSGSLLDSV